MAVASRTVGKIVPVQNLARRLIMDIQIQISNADINHSNNLNFYLFSLRIYQIFFDIKILLFLFIFY